MLICALFRNTFFQNLKILDYLKILDQSYLQNLLDLYVQRFPRDEYKNASFSVVCPTERSHLTTDKRLQVESMQNARAMPRTR
jgi:hypothetical protein